MRLILFLIIIILSGCRKEKFSEINPEEFEIYENEEKINEMNEILIEEKEICIPDCKDKECGDDGCGGSCNECKINEECVENKCKCLLWIKKSEELGIYGKGKASETEDKSYIFVGSAGVILKLNKYGDKVWKKPLSDKYNIITFSDAHKEGYVLIGTAYFPEKKYPKHQALILKINELGEIEWEKIFEEGSAPLLSIKKVNDGGYILAGGFIPIKAPYIIMHGDFWVLKIDNYGEIEWEKKYGKPFLKDWECYIGSPPPTIEGAFSIDNDYDGYIVAGYKIVSKVEDDTDICINDIEDHPIITKGIWIIKIDKEGNLVWDKTFEGRKVAYVISKTKDGGYIVGGAEFEKKMFVSDNKILIMKLNKEGHLEWEKIYQEPYGYGYIIIREFMIPTSDGGYIFTPANGVMIVKINEDGDIEWQKFYGEGLSHSIKETSDGGFIVGGGNEIEVLRIDSKGNYECK